MSRARGELPPEEESLLGIERDSPEQEAEAKRAFDEAQEFKRRFLVTLMQNQSFREWLMPLLDEFGTFENSFGVSPTGFPDPMATQFKLGMKAAGWRLWTLFDDLAPELASQMRREGAGKG